MTHRIALPAILLAALVPSLASAEPTSPQTIDVASEAHARLGYGPIDVGPPAFENSSGPAHTLLVSTFGGRWAVQRWLAVTGSLGGAAIVQPGNEGVPDGTSMPVPMTVGLIAATSLRDDLRVGGELRYARAVDSPDHKRAADVAASVFLHDPEVAWSQADRVTARGALTWTRGAVRWTAAAGLAQYQGGASVLEAGAGAAVSLSPTWWMTADAIAYTDAHDEGADEGYDLAGVMVGGIRHRTGARWDVGVTVSRALVDRMETEGEAGVGLAFDLRWSP